MKTQKKKRILISGYYGHGNIGDEAILLSIKKQLEGHDITVLSLDPEHTRRVHELDSISFFNIEEVEEIIKRSDMVIMGGGGLFQEFPDFNYYKVSISNLFKGRDGKLTDFAIVPIISAIYKKPLIFLGHGVGPFYSDEAKSFYGFIFSLPSLITVRDHYSYAWVNKIGRDNMVHLSADPAFLLQPEKQEKSLKILKENNLKEKEFITLSLRDWIYHTMLQNVVEEVVKALNSFLKENNLKVVFIPFQQIEKEGHPTQDRRIAMECIEKLDREIREKVIILKEELSIEEILDLMNKGLFGIGMRYHFLIFSLLSNIPFISISYDEKCNNLMKEIGLEELSINISEINHHLLQSKMDKVLKNIDEYRKIITHNVPEMKKRASHSFSLLHHLENSEFGYATCEYSTSERIDDLKEMKKYVQYKDEEIKDLKEEVIDLKEEVIDLKEEVIDLKEEVIDKEKIIEGLSFMLSQANTRLNSIYNSKTWRIGQFYGKLFGVEAKWRRSIQGLLWKRSYDDITTPVAKEIKESDTGIEQLREFLHLHLDKEEFYFIFCPAPFLNIGGQRGVRFAQELSAADKPVVFVRCLQDHLRDEVKRIEKNIIEYPLNWFFPVYGEIISSPLLKNKKKIMIWQVTFYNAFEIISFANAHGWITVYDIVDDWEEFYNEKFIGAYDREIERYIANNSDVLIAVNKALAEKFREFGDVVVIPNGYSPELLKERPAKKLKKGSITAGFFGHLHQARFNWDLLLKVAEKKKDWMFHIIGFGEPERLALPDNVLLLGPVEPSELSSYTKNWDVAIIPYQNNNLCKKLNPIKIFEYLYLGLPIVATGCEDVKHYPFTYYAEGEDEFIRYVEEASSNRVDPEKIADLLQEATWKNRLEQLLNILDKRDDFKKFCIGA